MRYTFEVKDYSLQKTLLSGQCFRWQEKKGGFWGVVGNSVLSVKQLSSGLVVDVYKGSISRRELISYFGLDVDYDLILSSISRDENVKNAVKKYRGYRILRQEPFETLISFICSTNSNIANTRAKVENLACLFGTQIGDQFSAFPDVKALADLSEEEIMKAKVGYRGKFIIETAGQLLKRDILNEVDGSKDEKAVELLTSLSGVGNKVADCVLLFAYNRFNRVPIDVWMKRILIKLYGQSEKAGYEKLEKFSQITFGKYAGYASHFLFELARKGELF